MIKKWLMLAMTCSSAVMASEVGYQQLALPDAGRPLALHVWYPAGGQGKPLLAAENMVFVGRRVSENASVAAGKHPLLVLSHGMGGNWRNQSWLAHALAQQGYVVAASNHPGTASGDIFNARTAAIWQRPRDLTRMINYLLGESAWQPAIDAQRIAAIGHSLGGWTVMMAAGARMDLSFARQDCARHPGNLSCQSMQQMGIALNDASLAASMRDERLKAVVTLDAGMTRTFSRESLAALPIPVLVLAAGEPLPGLAPEDESGRMAALLPQGNEYAVVPGAGHFSFMPPCKPGAAELLAREKAEPGDELVCLDGPGYHREAIHRQLLAKISQFLQTRLASGASQ